ncbi:MAG: hypothetical protein IPP51_11510 [Bacteroidetes bacterium]|nr:hypothetical protein [Bacteroidota bacterium]
MKVLATLFLIFIVSFQLKAQNAVEPCDKICAEPDTMPAYEDGETGLFDYIGQRIVPVVSDCMKNEKAIITSVYITLTINKVGQVVSVDFPRLKASDECKNKLRGAIMRMKGWKPAKFKGKPVCSQYLLPIPCMLWK